MMSRRITPPQAAKRAMNAGILGKNVKIPATSHGEPPAGAVFDIVTCNNSKYFTESGKEPAQFPD